jgi:signal transduction histidine kinase
VFGPEERSRAPSIGTVSPLVALVVGLVLGGAVAVTVVLGVRRDFGSPRPDPQVLVLPEAAMARRLLDQMDPAVVVVDVDDAVLLANPAARALGIVRGTRLLVPELLEVARAVRNGGGRRSDVRLPGNLVGGGPRVMGVHGVRLHSGTAPPPGPVGLVLQDITETRRTEAVRRDFVANVGHELKTPVGALALLAEAIEGAADDPEAVQRFAARIAHEADRLARLVRELIDLSRLQGGEPLPELLPVAVDDVLAEAVDRTRTAARAKDLEIAVGGQQGLVVRGVESQLITAVTNLLANAVAYSTGKSRIAVAARARSGFAEIAVTDSGVGIPRQDRQRVFERFYRVDQSRASSTGGTGLGLAIVKHVASNHGGSVTVWSEEGLGSTFTLRIPLAAGSRASSTNAPVTDAPSSGDAVAADPGKGTA